ncbi:hypothetical protein [Hymenobacter bucti]|uniref:Uncharacterized protein n=1 Tax=Hymenobacter bucti TaxID=1844114 RepID=A0ABW4R1X7_9BACT
MKTTLLLLLLLWSICSKACTIVSGTDRHGQTWAMNNEDFFHTYANYVNVYPASGKHTLGYLTLTFGAPDGSIQGGSNEAGVFFDMNALPPQTYKLRKGRKPFPYGSMLVYLLQRCQSVPQFLALWDTYYLPDMGDVQLHVADKHGNLAIITPDTIVQATKQLASANFNVCEAGPGKASCWRYPITQKLLASGGISQENLVKIAAATSWREFTTTLYTNIHNLTTGDIWFYLAEDYHTPWRTSMRALLQGGKRSLLLANQFPRNASLQLTRLLATKQGAPAVDKFLQKGQFSARQKESLLRLAFLHQFYVEKDFTKASLLFPFWERYLPVNHRLDSTEVQFTKAEVLATQGAYAAAVRVLQAVRKPSWKTNALLANLRDSEPPNAVIELDGFKAAPTVVVELKGEYNFYRFLLQTPTGWVLHLKTDRKELKYCFYIAGKRVVDPTQPQLEKQETVKGDLATFNVLRL